MGFLQILQTGRLKHHQKHTASYGRRHHVFTPEDERIEPENDTLEDVFPFPGVKSLRFHVTPPGCT